jgi:hypothetical protein
LIETKLLTTSGDFTPTNQFQGGINHHLNHPTLKYTKSYDRCMESHFTTDSPRDGLSSSDYASN